MISLDQLKELLEYDPETGVFLRRKTVRVGLPAGSVAGTVRNGYLSMTLKGKLYQAHRLAWFYMTGRWPKALIDHIDLDKTNNRFANLREATHSQNKANRHAPANNPSGVKGVRFYEGKWQAAICKEYKQMYLGSFATKEEAAAAYRDAATRLFGEFARTST